MSSTEAVLVKPIAKLSAVPSNGEHDKKKGKGNNGSNPSSRKNSPGQSKWTVKAPHLSDGSKDASKPTSPETSSNGSPLPSSNPNSPISASPPPAASLSSLSSTSAQPVPHKKVAIAQLQPHAHNHTPHTPPKKPKAIAQLGAPKNKSSPRTHAPHKDGAVHSSTHVDHTVDAVAAKADLVSDTTAELEKLSVKQAPKELEPKRPDEDIPVPVSNPPEEGAFISLAPTKMVYAKTELLALARFATRPLSSARNSEVYKHRKKDNHEDGKRGDRGSRKDYDNSRDRRNKDDRGREEREERDPYFVATGRPQDDFRGNLEERNAPSWFTEGDKEFKLGIPERNIDVLPDAEADSGLENLDQSLNKTQVAEATPVRVGRSIPVNLPSAEKYKLIELEKEQFKRRHLNAELAASGASPPFQPATASAPRAPLTPFDKLLSGTVPEVPKASPPSSQTQHRFGFSLEDTGPENVPEASPPSEAPARSRFGFAFEDTDSTAVPEVVSAYAPFKSSFKWDSSDMLTPAAQKPSVPQPNVYAELAKVSVPATVTSARPVEPSPTDARGGLKVFSKDALFQLAAQDFSKLPPMPSMQKEVAAPEQSFPKASPSHVNAQLPPGFPSGPGPVPSAMPRTYPSPAASLPPNVANLFNFAGNAPVPSMPMPSAMASPTVPSASPTGARPPYPSPALPYVVQSGTPLWPSATQVQPHRPPIPRQPIPTNMYPGQGPMPQYAPNHQRPPAPLSMGGLPMGGAPPQASPHYQHYAQPAPSPSGNAGMPQGEMKVDLNRLFASGGMPSLPPMPTMAADKMLPASSLEKRFVSKQG